VSSASRTLAWLLVAVVAAGCGTPSSATPGATGRPPIAATVDVESVIAIPGKPLDVVTPGDGSGRLFVVDQGGAIWLLSKGKLGADAFLDIGSKVSHGGEQGLLGLAFHPGYPDDPRFYLDYTNAAGDTVVSEWHVSGDSTHGDPRSEKIVLTVPQPFANHNGGDIVFGPDGYLYITLGDGGSGGDPQGNGQKLSTLLGKILRIDLVHPSEGRTYGIPADNPFLSQSGAQPEIYVTGLRNPWRISFDRTTKDLWIGDVGQNAFEEIDVVRAGSRGGQNFGWNRMEGFHCFPSGETCSIDGLTPPVTEYGHALGCSVTGGFVYRGTAFPKLVGSYLFSDYCSGTIWAIDAAAKEVRDPAIVGQTHRAISSFGEDEAGELYATDLAGELLRVVEKAP
jgi:glucose/arabinose dehydrogenase